MNNVKTYKGWKGKFETYFHKGNEIDQEAYNHFLNILPPISLNSGHGYCAGFQVSEPDSDGIDVDGNTKILYSTFGMKDNKYYYLGLNFRGEVNSQYTPVPYCIFG